MGDELDPGHGPTLPPRGGGSSLVSAPGLIVAAPASGSGKTTLTLGILAALRRRGVPVGSFKVGPDYIDPAFHAAATGRATYNIDPWAMRFETLAGPARGERPGLRPPARRGGHGPVRRCRRRHRVHRRHRGPVRPAGAAGRRRLRHGRLGRGRDRRLSPASRGCRGGRRDPQSRRQRRAWRAA